MAGDTTTVLLASGTPKAIRRTRPYLLVDNRPGRRKMPDPGSSDDEDDDELDEEEEESG